MPYNNEYNQHIAQEMGSIYNNHIAYEQLTNDNVHPNDITSQVEGMALRDDHVKGGSGYAAATLHDLGYELRADRRDDRGAGGQAAADGRGRPVGCRPVG